LKGRHQATGFRFQVSGIRHQGLGNETGAAQAEVGLNGEDLSLEAAAFAAPAALPNGQETLKPDACSLMPIAKPVA
jgi:hypothetical protein